MSDLLLRKTVTNLADATAAAPITTSSVTPQPIITGWPVGDNLLRTLVVRFSGTVAITLGGGTLAVNALQMAQLIQNFLFGTNLHNNIIENGVDGVSLFRMLSLAAKADLYSLDIPQTTTTNAPFGMVLKIPLLNERAARAWDTVVDILTAQAYIRRVYNSTSAIGTITGGSSTLISVTSLNIETSVEHSRGPFVDKQGQPAFGTVAPNYIPYWAVYPVSITATKAQMPIYLPYGDRIYKKIFIFQRDATTGAELANTICGVNDQDRISLKLNGLPICDAIEFLSLQQQNQQEFKPATMPVGAAVIDFDKVFTDDKVRGSRLSNNLNLITPGQQTFELDIDVTKPGSGNPYLYIGMECVRPLPDTAKRPEQMQPKTKAVKAASQSGQ